MNPSGLPDTCGIETFFFQQRMVWNADLSKWTKINVGISVLFKTQTELKDVVYQKKNLSGHWDLLIALAKLNTEYL